MYSRLSAGIAGVALAAAIALPVSAVTPDRFVVDDTVDVAHSCGIVEHLHVEGAGTAYFAADGTWLRDAIQFRYSSTFQSTITGRTLETSSRQFVVLTPDGLSAAGQGFFVRADGAVIVLDVGRLVANGEGTTLFATPKVIRLDDAAASAAAEAALCDALG